MTASEQDKKFIKECIRLSAESVARGDGPFGALIVKGEKIIDSSVNNAANKISDHAEILVLHAAYQQLGNTKLSGCVLYSNCEPCPMCSFMAREYWISRVVYSLPSPFMGGHSKWNILEDRELAEFPPFFGPVPEIIGGVLEQEAKLVFDKTPLWMFGSNPQKR